MRIIPTVPKIELTLEAEIALKYRGHNADFFPFPTDVQKPAKILFKLPCVEDLDRYLGPIRDSKYICFKICFENFGGQELEMDFIDKTIADCDNHIIGNIGLMELKYHEKILFVSGAYIHHSIALHYIDNEIIFFECKFNTPEIRNPEKYLDGFYKWAKWKKEI
jgi:hypothetical protein